MIGKIITGSDPSGCARYCLDHDEARILWFDGLDIDPEQMTRLNEAVKAERGALSLTIAGDIGRSFHMQASLNTKVVKPVMHIALSFMKEDEPALTDRRMSEIAEDYLRRMKLDNTQYVVIRHHKPGGNPHVHIILNLVGNDGNRLDTDFIRRRNINVCKDLNRAYGLHWSRGKDNTDVEKLRSKEKTRYEIYHAVKSALNGSSGWRGFERKLLGRNVTCQLVRKNDGSVQGINFSKWNSSDGRYYTFKGSVIDRSMSYSGLMKQLEKNSIDESENVNQSGASRPESYVLGVLVDLMESQTPEVQKDNNDKQKRKKRRI